MGPVRSVWARWLCHIRRGTGTLLVSATALDLHRLLKGSARAEVQWHADTGFRGVPHTWPYSGPNCCGTCLKSSKTCPNLPPLLECAAELPSPKPWTQIPTVTNSSQPVQAESEVSPLSKVQHLHRPVSAAGLEWALRYHDHHGLQGRWKRSRTKRRHWSTPGSRSPPGTNQMSKLMTPNQQVPLPLSPAPCPPPLVQVAGYQPGTGSKLKGRFRGTPTGSRSSIKPVRLGPKEMALGGNGCTVRTRCAPFGAITWLSHPNWTLTKRYYTATLAPGKRPRNGYHMSFLRSKLNLDCI